MSLSVLITRPVGEAEDYAGELEEYGFKTFLAPMLMISPLSFEVFDDFDVLIFTSAQGVRVYFEGGGLVKGQAICVGKYTAREARAVGFNDVLDIAGTGKDIVNHIADTNTDQSVPSLRYIHVGGKNVAYPIAQELSAAGFQCVHVPVYDAPAVDAIPDDVVHAMRENSVDVITFFSKRTAETFLDLVKTQNLQDTLNTIKCLSISDAVLECVRFYKYEWNELYVSSKPDRAGMLEQLQLIEGEMKHVSKPD